MNCGRTPSSHLCVWNYFCQTVRLKQQTNSEHIVDLIKTHRMCLYILNTRWKYRWLLVKQDCFGTGTALVKTLTNWKVYLYLLLLWTFIILPLHEGQKWENTIKDTVCGFLVKEFQSTRHWFLNLQTANNSSQIKYGLILVSRGTLLHHYCV